MSPYGICKNCGWEYKHHSRPSDFCPHQATKFECITDLPSKTMKPEDKERIEKEAIKYALELVDEYEGTPQFICYRAGAESEHSRLSGEIMLKDKRIAELERLNKSFSKERKNLAKAIDLYGDQEAKLVEALSRTISDIDSADYDGRISMATYGIIKELLNKA